MMLRQFAFAGAITRSIAANTLGYEITFRYRSARYEIWCRTRVEFRCAA
jgi:hypothetical protein